MKDGASSRQPSPEGYQPPRPSPVGPLWAKPNQKVRGPRALGCDPWPRAQGRRAVSRAPGQGAVRMGADQAAARMSFIEDRVVLK